MTVKFTLHNSDKKARRGTLHTAHGDIQTPVFMPVGTAGTVKAMTMWDVESTGSEIILGNTYHLMLRPTAERVAEFGGLHKFIGWDKPILTDSGGFQVMSLASMRKITEQGAVFKSHLSGEKFELSPERSIEIQHLLGADITMQFDECISLPAPHSESKRAMELSLRWAERSKKAFIERDGYGLFGIVQGGLEPDLRKISIKELTDLDLPGYAIGGLAVGEGQEKMFGVLDYTAESMPENKPRYLMGVGKPDDIVGAVARGVDMFDCVIPTRMGRTGTAFTARGQVNLKNARHKDDKRPISDNCSCPACTKYTRGYLHHLIKSDEILGLMLLSWHNIQYYQDLMSEIRKAIENNEFDEFQVKFNTDYKGGDIAPI
ncbi:MAG: tRNA guanosine(34) transglycosylase Tgt [Alphaproteobacteria bacterium]|jgi:queuine tRNA-ribosyltransferase|nr:tRNA guanosine(34) transglycosylase Tgt [Alphaproteobacteria bacterium]